MRKNNKVKRPLKKPSKKNAGKTIKAFAKFLVSIKKYRGWIIVSIILAMGSAILGIFIPKILGDLKCG